jgi:hypothetical protein
MKNQFADYEISKMLKELVFNESCFGEYDQEGGFRYCNMSSIIIDEFTGNTICAPIWQQIKEWLWEKHQINIETERVNITPILFKTRVYQYMNKEAGLITYLHFESPIKAETEAIKTAVEFLYSQTAAGCSAKNNGA